MANESTRTKWLVAGLIAALLAVAIGFQIPVAAADHRLGDRPGMALLLLAFFLVAQGAVVHLEIRRQGFLVSPTEIPLLLALFYLPPLEVVLIRVIALAVSQLLRRTAPVKAVFNVALLAAGTAVATYVTWTFAPLDAARPSSWAVLMGAVIAANLVTFIGISAVITIVQGRLSWREFIASAISQLLFGLVTAAVGLVAMLALQVTPWAAVPLCLLAVIFVFAYQTYSRFRRQHRSLAEIYAFTRSVEPARRQGTLVDDLLTRVRDLLNAETATLWLPEQGRHPEVLLTARADDRGLWDQPTLADSARQKAIETGETVVAGAKVGQFPLPQGIKDLIVTPLRSGDVVIGCLEVANRLGDFATFEPADVQLLETLAAHVGVAVENDRLVDRLRFDAYHDALTNLPNRRRMLIAITEAMRAATAADLVAILMFDVGGMRDVNDSVGHAAGDQLLAEVGRRLATLAPPSALVSRVAGDEFGVLLRVPDTEAAITLATRLRHELQYPLTIGTLNIDVDTACGVAVYPEHGTDPAILLQRADVAKHAAKTVTSAVQLFNPGLESRSVRRLGLAGDLRRALDHDEVQVYYQPKVALESRELVGVECLVRWEHPAHGAVDPEDFVTVAEHTGQLGRLTDVVLREGLRRARHWADEGRPLSVAVNLSPRTLVDPAFPAHLESLLDEARVPPELLILEITEHGVLSETDKPLPTLRRLRDLGVRLSVDDFGTGYSSLLYLRRLPVHEVKIDRSFVQGMATDAGDLAIVRAVVDLSRHFGLSVVAEGVESELTLSLLEGMGCDIGQGFFFSRPLPYERLEAWLAARTEPAQPVTGGRPVSTARRLRVVT